MLWVLRRFEHLPAKMCNLLHELLSSLTFPLQYKLIVVVVSDQLIIDLNISNFNCIFNYQMWKCASHVLNHFDASWSPEYLYSAGTRLYSSTGTSIIQRLGKYESLRSVNAFSIPLPSCKIANMTAKINTNLQVSTMDVSWLWETSIIGLILNDPSNCFLERVPVNVDIAPCLMEWFDHEGCQP